MMWSGSNTIVREAEQARVAGAIYSAASGRATVCVVEGGTGSGKTAFINDAAASAASVGFTVIEVTHLSTSLPALDPTSPHCVVIDDAHLSGGGLLAAVEALLDQRAGPSAGRGALLLIGTSFTDNPTIRRLSRAADSQGSRITLPGMSPRQLNRALQTNGFVLSAEDLAAVHDASGGHPGLALASLRDNQTAPRAVADALISPELDRLSPPLRAYLEVLSLATAPLPDGVIAEVASLVTGQPSSVDHASTLRPLLGDDLDRVLLTNPAWRRTVAAHIRPARAARIHHLLAERTTGLPRGLHLSALAGPDGDGNLAADLEDQANAALLEGDYDQAARLMGVAVSVSRGEERQRRLIEAGLMVAVAGRTDDTAGIGAGVALLGTHPMATVLEAGVAFFQDQFPTARSLIHRVVQSGNLDPVRPGTDHTTQWRALVLLAVIELAHGREEMSYRAARKAHELGFEPDTPVDRRLGHVLTMQETASLWTLGRPADAVAALDAVMPHLPGTADYADALYVRGRFHFYAGRTREALRDLECAELEAQHRVVPAAAQRGMAEHAMIEFHLGRWHAATIKAERVVELARTTPADSWGLATAHAVLAMASAARGDLATSSEHRDWLAHDITTHSRVPLVNAMAARAWCARLSGDVDSVLDIVGAFRRTELASWTDAVALHCWRAFEVEALIDTGQYEKAEALLAEFADRVVARPGLPLPYGHPESLRGRLAAARSNLRVAEQHYRAAIALGADFHYGRGRDLRYLSEVQRSLGRHVAADESLYRSREILVRLGAEPELTTAPPGPQPVAGRFAELTEREQDVAYLLSQGLTNKEIAEHLVVTVKTVEYHVSNILPKLGMQSRREMWSAVDILARRSTPPGRR